jgi:uncharacterized protein YdeI (YjbR/CyaY-like superfamily)
MFVTPLFFRSQDAFRRWMKKNHDRADELHVGYYKKHTGKPSITWPESVDVALCFGWIDGIRRSLDEDRYTIRFTPRRAESTWSEKNVASARRLIAAGAMEPSGLAAFENRGADRSGVYSFEQRELDLDPARRKRLRANRKAWTYWNGQPPGYRKKVTWWVMSAKREETRDRRLEALIADSEAGRWVKPMRVGRAKRN